MEYFSRVNAINHIELKSVVDFLSCLKGAELQKITGSLKKLHFHFWNKGPKILAFCPLAQKPFLVYGEDKSLFDSNIKRRIEDKPIVLFLKSHVFGEFVKDVKVHESNKRVFEIHFENGAHLEFRVFSGGGNTGVYKNDKKVFLRRPQDLISDSGEGYKPEFVRSPQVIFEQGLEELLKKSEAISSKDKDLNKAVIARDKIKKAIEDLDDEKILKFAKALEADEPLDEDLKSLFRSKLSARENIEWAYSQVKASAQKKQRLLDRLEVLSKDLESKQKKKTQVSTSSKKNVKTSGVVFQLRDNLLLRCGRNAKENLELLRASKAWHIWMHLSDYPSGHLIIDRPKNYELTAEELEKSAHFLFLRGAPKKLLNSPTQRYEVMFTECRFVRTQKSKKGLVTTQKHSSLTFTWKSDYLHMF